MQKPTFGATQATNTGTTPQKEYRPEMGAIWEKTSKENTTFMNIRLKLSKAKIQELLAAAEGDEVSVNFVAFPNRNKSADNQPSFRIFEEKKRV